MSIYCHFFHFFINLSVYFNFCIHSLAFLSFLIDSQGLLFVCFITVIFTSFYPFLPQMNVHPLTGFWPFRSKRPFEFSTSFSTSKTFWFFDIVSSNEGVLCFLGLLKCLHHYACTWPLRAFYTLLSFWGLLRC